MVIVKDLLWDVWQQHSNQQRMTSATSTRAEQVRSEVDELKDIMVRNIGLYNFCTGLRWSEIEE